MSQRKNAPKSASLDAPFLPPFAPDRAAGETPERRGDPRTQNAPGKSQLARPARREDDGSAPDPVLAPGLYVTATPIGNARDITLRALTVLGKCDAIVAEDTRVTSRLLALYGISRPLLVYNDHNAPAMRPKLLERLKQEARLALVSDAGTPLISDPGYKLVREAREAGLAVFAVPGPSAAVAALSVAGLPSDRFFFAGFLPAKPGERRTALSGLNTIPATLIFFEAPQRLAGTLAAMAEVFGPREAAVARELTKRYEEVRRGRLDGLAAHYSATAPKGEIVVLVGPPETAAPDEARAGSLLKKALAFMPVKAAAELVAEATGMSRRDLYLRALAMRGQGDGPSDAEA